METRDKIALFCDVERRAVVPVPTVRSIYEVPARSKTAGLGDFVIERLGLTGRAPVDLADWRAHGRADAAAHSTRLKVAIVGKYVELQDAYLSVKESLIHAGAGAEDTDVEILWVHSESLDAPNVEREPARRATRSSCRAASASAASRAKCSQRATRARTTCPTWASASGSSAGHRVRPRRCGEQTPTRRSSTSRRALSSTYCPSSGPRGQGRHDAARRLPGRLTPGTTAQRRLRATRSYERHRHRYEFNNAYREPLETPG